MEKIDVLGLSVIAIGIFTFINILAIRALFCVVEILRKAIYDVVNCINDNIVNQYEINKNHTDFISKLTNQVGGANEVIMAILKMIQRSNNHNSPTGGQETSN